MQTLPIRLTPRQDLRSALEAALLETKISAAFVLQGIGSLSVTHLRLAGKSEVTQLRGDLEILTLAGTLSPDGAHLHISVADAQGNVTGGHVAPGCIIRTTAEILLGLLPDHNFRRKIDPATGFKELLIGQG